MTFARAKNQKGQVLVAVFFLMILALGIGITISSRYIKNVKSFVQADDTSKALSVAEAAVENILLIPDFTLEEYVDLGTCGDDCYLEFTDNTGRTLSATVTLSYLGSGSESYFLPVTITESSQVLLNGYGEDAELYVCWDDPASIHALYIYEDGDIESDAYAYNAVGSSYSDNNFDEAAAAHGHANCFTINTWDTPLLLRLKAYYEDSDVYIISSGGNSLPIQGILIDSVGTAGDAVKRVQVVKSKPAPPTIFDYALYQSSEVDPLSN
jgi:hypothetical protein